LIALLLPAVQSAREAARRAQCVNNLKQIGLAMHNYESTNGAFPPGSLYYGFGAGNASSFKNGWSIRILSFMEQRQVYDSYNFYFTFTNWANQTAVATSISSFVCPSSPRGGEVLQGIPNLDVGYILDPTRSAARSDYFTARTVVPAWYSDDPELAAALQWTNQTPIAAITDGTSNTLLAYEVAGKPDYYSRRSLVQAWSANADSNVYFETGAWGGYMNMRLVTWKGTAPGGTCTVDCRNGWDYDGPCVVNCHNGWNAVYSFHPGGVNTLACDGSVRFVKESVSASVFLAFATRAQGEIISADAL
jgi:prepilin-type processing-associated H-X9-DG protein